VAPEGSGWSKLAQLMPNHILGYKHGDVLPTIVNCYCQPNHIWQNHRTSRPGFDRAFAIFCCGFVNLLYQMKIDEGAFTY